MPCQVFGWGRQSALQAQKSLSAQRVNKNFDHETQDFLRILRSSTYDDGAAFDALSSSTPRERIGRDEEAVTVILGDSCSPILPVALSHPCENIVPARRLSLCECRARFLRIPKSKQKTLFFKRRDIGLELKLKLCARKWTSNKSTSIFLDVATLSDLSNKRIRLPTLQAQITNEI